MEDIKLSELNKEECDRLVGVFELLMKMDKKQNPENYQKEGSEKEGGVTHASSI